MDKQENKLRQDVFEAAIRYYDYKFKDRKPFAPGDPIKYAGRVFDQHEIINLIDASLDFWLTAGRYAEQFEESLAKYLGVRYCSLTNSGSSANLLAFSALTSPKLGERRIRKGDEVITVAASFPTTIAPIVQHGAVPVFVDIELPTYNVDCSQLEAALSRRTKAVMLAHTLGNPFDLQTVRDFCDRHGLWLIEDNCDALGAQYFFNSEWKYTGTIGDLGTSSFYPPHHITTGEGGAVYTNNLLLKQLVDSFRDWGRDCTCPPGRDNTCNRRFSQQFGSLPPGYDHKYVYSHFGYNLKMTDLQAAIGCAQLAKLPAFIEARNRNWQLLRKGLDNLSDYFILPEPAPNSKPSWFGFLLTVKENAGFCRNEIVKFIESKGIQTRMLFAGNMKRQPCFNKSLEQDSRVVSDLKNTDKVLNQSFWIGAYPCITEEMISYMIAVLNQFCANLPEASLI
jgi:CDP-6-deoxy-D-xylo-4-hexulose-3-dehydrase